MWHFIGKGPISSKQGYCQGRVVQAIRKHLSPIPCLTVENLLRNRHLNLKNEKIMLRNCNFNFFFQQKTISSSCMRISGYNFIYNSSACNHQQLCARKQVRNPSRQQLENKKIWNKGPIWSFLKKILMLQYTYPKSGVASQNFFLQQSEPCAGILEVFKLQL